VRVVSKFKSNPVYLPCFQSNKQHAMQHTAKLQASQGIAQKQPLYCKGSTAKAAGSAMISHLIEAGDTVTSNHR
jgi:hypothetical protein